MADAPRIRSIIKRTTLIVRDIKKSRHWYEHVLGMTTWLDTEITLTGEGLCAGAPGDRTHLVIMRAEDEKIGMIGLLQWLDPPLPAPEIPTSVSYGLPVFVVETDDAPELARRAQALGTRIYNPGREFTMPGADGGTRHLIGVSLFDPDGHFLECNQVLATNYSEESA